MSIKQILTRILNELANRDYIIEQGTDGIWTYIKRKSGVSECWGTMTQNIISWSTWGVLYEGTASIQTETYPNGLFISAPDFWANPKGNSVGAFTEIYGKGTNTTTPQVYALRPTTGNIGNFKFSLYAKGVWK